MIEFKGFHCSAESKLPGICLTLHFVAKSLYPTDILLDKSDQNQSASQLKTYVMILKRKTWIQWFERLLITYHRRQFKFGLVRFSLDSSL